MVLVPEPKPELGFRFAVVFFQAGVVPLPLDFRFQRVSGLSTQVTTTSVREGGQNSFSHKLPDRIDRGNLVLERGFLVGSLLNIELVAMLSSFTFAPWTVMVTLLHEDGPPLAGWMFLRAYPVKWATSDLDANEYRVAVDTIELAYTRMQVLRV